MKRSLRYICAFLMLLMCLASCSGHTYRPAPAPAAPAESPALVTEPEEEKRDGLDVLLCAAPWGNEKELCLLPDGSGTYKKLPISWQRSGAYVYIRFLPDCELGRLMTLRADRSGPAPALYGEGLWLELSLCVNNETLRLERREALRQEYLAIQRMQGEQISQAALSFVGGRYKYGGKSPETGFDCSGLVWYLYDRFGYSIERVAAAQATQGIHVEPEEMLPGDLLAFRTSGSYVGHVGIYVGNGCYVHAMGEAYGIVLSSLDDPYLKRDFEARRLIGRPELMKYIPAGYAELMYPEEYPAEAG